MYAGGGSKHSHVRPRFAAGFLPPHRVLSSESLYQWRAQQQHLRLGYRNLPYSTGSWNGQFASREREGSF